jgi:hypothetical protein
MAFKFGGSGADFLRGSGDGSGGPFGAQASGNIAWFDAYGTGDMNDYSMFGSYNEEGGGSAEQEGLDTSSKSGATGQIGDTANDNPMNRFFNKLGLPNSSTSVNAAFPAAQKSSDLRAGGYREAAEIFKQYLSQSLDNLRPFGEAAGEALGRIGELMSDPSSLMDRADVQFRKGEGTKAVESLQSKRGDLFSSQGGKDMVRFNQEFVSQELDNALAREHRILQSTMHPVMKFSDNLMQSGRAMSGLKLGEIEADADYWDFIVNYTNRADSDAAGLTGSIFGGVMGMMGGGGGGGGGGGSGGGGGGGFGNSVSYGNAFGDNYNTGGNQHTFNNNFESLK